MGYNIRPNLTSHVRTHLKGGSDPLEGTLDFKYGIIGTVDAKYGIIGTVDAGEVLVGSGNVQYTYINRLGDIHLIRPGHGTFEITRSKAIWTFKHDTTTIIELRKSGVYMTLKGTLSMGQRPIINARIGVVRPTPGTGAVFYRDGTLWCYNVNAGSYKGLAWV